MLAEVISIGDEMTSGQRLDTNSQWLSVKLGEIGVRTLYHTTVADDLEANVRVFRAAMERADLIVATGGLGPTADDLTRQALAAVLGVELVLDAPSLAHIESLFARRKRPMPERNRIQAMFPAGARVIPNPAGTAPGIDLDVPRPNRSAARIVALPGVPVEMREMWQGTVEATLRQWLGAPRLIRHRRIKCFGVGESDLEAMLPDLIRRGRSPQVGITVHGATITLRISAEGSSPAECATAMEPTIVTIRDCLKDLVFGEEDDELEHAVVRILAERGATLATAECATGGMIAQWLSQVDQCEKVFLGGIIGRTLDECARLLDRSGSERSDSDRSRGDSSSSGGARNTADDPVAKVARRLQERTSADWALANGELPSLDDPAPELRMAVASASGVTVVTAPYVGHPDILKSRGAKQALNLVRLKLLRGE